MVAGLAVDPKAVYVPCLNNKLYAFDAMQGNQLWEQHLEGRLDQTPLTPGGTVYIVGSGKGLYALTASRGEVKWFVPGVEQILARSGDRLLALDELGNILVIVTDSGTVDKTLAAPNIVAWAFNTTDGTAYGATADGRLVALDALR